MQALSVVIIAQDEERTIGRVLEAVKDLASEIILLDSGSTDRTLEIAGLHGAKIKHQDWLGYAAQKNMALSMASSPWILSLDADEILSPELAEEIKQLLSGDLCENFDGFKIARLMFVGDAAIAHGGFYPDAQLRLFRRGMGRFNDRLVHESLQLNGRVTTLKNHLLHLSYRDIQEFKNAHEKYARLSAQEALRSGFKSSKASYLNLLLHPLWTFFYRYICRGGFLDGELGLKMNLAYSHYVRKKILYLREALTENAAARQKP
ncbi:MAG: glycosyltransferase family 2 protein [Candidatus Obscuribacterales bacterium]|nr:glycosyltransferase family 2 protein [Candidatus Obscuribacterales bacterium]